MSGLSKALGGKRKSGVAPADHEPAEAKPQSKRAKAADEAARITNEQWLNSDKPLEGPEQENYREEDIRLGSILIDQQNHRTRYINVAKPTENVLERTHPDYEKNQELIDNLIEFAEHVKNEPLRQRPGVYRYSNRIYMAYGHRRFLALLIAFGPNYVYKFKVYPNKPKDLAKARFQENVQRVDVPLGDKILDFKDAQAEATKLLEAENSPINGKIVASRLGIAPSSYSIFDRALQKDFLVKMIEQGTIKEFDALRRVINSQSEDDAKQKLGLAKPPQKPKSTRGRPKKYVQFPKITNRDLFKKIVDGGLAEFDWKEEDFESYDAISAKLTECIEALSNR